MSKAGPWNSGDGARSGWRAIGGRSTRSARVVAPTPLPATSATVRALCHDFRHPLSVIERLAELDGLECRDDEARKRLGEIGREAAWLSELVSTVLGERSAREVQALDLAEAARFASELASTDARCPITVDAARPVRVLGCRADLVRAVMCLLDNAIRAAGADGHVQVEVGGDATSGWVSITDDGPGLGGLSPQHSLGVAIVRAILADHGGRLVLSNHPGGGALAVMQVPKPE
jgi:signal transduction histidine kinase